MGFAQHHDHTVNRSVLAYKTLAACPGLNQQVLEKGLFQIAWWGQKPGDITSVVLKGGAPASAVRKRTAQMESNAKSVKFVKNEVDVARNCLVRFNSVQF